MPADRVCRHTAKTKLEIMLRKIDTRQLQPGMYLQELCGTWINHPFWRTSFKLKDDAQIAKILNSGINSYRPYRTPMAYDEGS